MRVMMFVKASKDSEAGVMPSPELIGAMSKFNEELMKAGVLLDLAGLKPSSNAARVKHSGGSCTVTDGPFTETKELVAGYWLIEVPSKADAIAWASRVPCDAGNGKGEMEIEIRPLFGLEDFEPCEGVERGVELGKELAKQKH